MTGIKGFALMAIGILVFSATCIYANDQYSDPGTQESTDLDVEASDLLKEVRTSLSVNRTDGSFDHETVLSAQAQALAKGKGEYQLEIIDVSGYDTSYSRSVAFGNAIQTSAPPSVVGEGEMVTIHSAANIYVGQDEVHAARLIFRHWEA